MASISKNVQAAGKRQSGKPKAALSPRGRGSVPPVPDPDCLLRLFGTNLRRVRVARGLSQEALGDLSDIDDLYEGGNGMGNVAFAIPAEAVMTGVWAVSYGWADPVFIAAS